MRLPVRELPPPPLDGQPRPGDAGERASVTTDVVVRLVSEDDLLDLTDMFERCSNQTRYRRFHSYVRAFPEPYLTDALKGDHGHFALVAETPDGIVALASCVALDEGSCEIGILVEVRYQRQRIGTRLLEALLEHAGDRTVRAHIQHDRSWLIPVLLRHEQIRVFYS
jgi:GNAT superfamily N-acetyltransferase